MLTHPDPYLRIPLLNEVIKGFLETPWKSPPEVLMGNVMASKEFNTLGLSIPRQTGKTQTLKKIFLEDFLQNNVALLVKLSHTKKEILDNVPKNLRQAVGARIFLTVRELNAAEDVFPDNGKRNLLLADDYTVDGIYRSLDKKKYDVPIKVLALAT